MEKYHLRERVNGNTTRTGFSIGVSHICCRSVHLLKVLKVESIIFSGYSSFRNCVHCSVLKCSVVDDSRSAQLNMVLQIELQNFC